MVAITVSLLDAVSKRVLCAKCVHKEDKHWQVYEYKQVMHLVLRLLYISALGDGLKLPTRFEFKQQTQMYIGGLLGVSAHVTLFKSNRSASIHLVGFPVGGSCHGSATLDALGSISITGSLNKMLSRTGMRIVSVDLSVDQKHLWVLAAFPLGLGTRKIELVQIAF